MVSHSGERLVGGVYPFGSRLRLPRRAGFFIEANGPIALTVNRITYWGNIVALDWKKVSASIPGLGWVCPLNFLSNGLLLHAST